ncbi:hypothetical protein MTYP_02368 [Methylophilaceae bacterium]|nr:hypothetical protein MTYP_02368 [Methylophilaceae bacterium]
MKIMRFILASAIIVLGASSSAYARDSVGFSISIGSPGYYYAPPPVYYHAPPVVYYRPAPVYHHYYSAPRAYYHYDKPRIRHDYRHGHKQGWGRGHH